MWVFLSIDRLYWYQLIYSYRSIDRFTSIDEPGRNTCACFSNPIGFVFLLRKGYFVIYQSYQVYMSFQNQNHCKTQRWKKVILCSLKKRCGEKRVWMGKIVFIFGQLLNKGYFYGELIFIFLRRRSIVYSINSN